jgi:hypothetical protein
MITIGLVRRSATLMSAVMSLASSPAQAQSFCLGLLESTEAIIGRALSDAEIASEVAARSSLIQASRLRGGFESGAVLEDLSAREFDLLSKQAQSLARLVLGGVDGQNFGLEVAELRKSNDRLVQKIEQLTSTLKPTGVLGRMVRSLRAPSRDRIAALENEVVNCRIDSASCVQSLRTSEADYRRIYARLGHFQVEVNNRLAIWGQVGATLQADDGLRMDVGSRLIALTSMRAMLDGLISKMDQDLSLAGMQVRTLDGQVPSLLAGAVAAGADPAILAPVKTHEEMARDQRLRSEANRLAQREADRLEAIENERLKEERANERRIQAKIARREAEEAARARAAAEVQRAERRTARLVAARKRDQERDKLLRAKKGEEKARQAREDRQRFSARIEEIILHTSKKGDKRLVELHQLLALSKRRITADQAMDILDSLDPGVDGSRFTDPYPNLEPIIEEITGRGLYESRNGFAVDLDLVALLLTRTVPEQNVSLRNEFVDRIQLYWKASQDLHHENRGDRWQTEGIEETLNELVSRWEDKGRRL